ncbi:hypothetical protein [Sulfuricurvum sp.]|uniref:hypothetical protein n=1 Tax=Sulfuricurvum sp. TaxID=2025608 RepID=UPI0035685D1F
MKNKKDERIRIDVHINPLIYQQVDPNHIDEYIARGRRGIELAEKGNREIIDCVESLKQCGGYGGLGDFASYEYCMWTIEKRPPMEKRHKT